MATAVHELDLPLLDTMGMERSEALAATVEARRKHWLARSPLGFSVTGYEDAVAILRDRRFHSALALVPEMAGVQPEEGLENRRRRSILTMEGEEHSRLRRLVAPAFTPASADRLRPFMRQVIGELVDGVCEAGRCELVVDVCESYPIPIICRLLGAPDEDGKLFSNWATDIFRIFNQDLVNDQHLIQRAIEELREYVSLMIEERRAEPAEDLLSELIAVEESGDRLSSDELVMLAQAILMAGTDTTRNQLACSVALFADHPDQWAMLAEHPDLAPRAVEETMRYLGAIRGTARFAAEDVEYRGVLFPKGTLVSVAIASANRDPSRFSVPDSFDIGRERDSAQMTFGSGIHHCLGAALARAELQEALTTLSRRMPGLALDGPVEWKPPSFGIWGPSRLPLRFDTPQS